MKYFLMWNNGRENVYALKKWTAARWTVGCKGKVTHAQESIVGVHLPLPDLEPVDGEPLMSVMRGQCDAGPMVTFPAARHHRPLAGTKLYCLVTEARVLSWPGCTREWGGWNSNPRPIDRKFGTLPVPHRATQLDVVQRNFQCDIWRHGLISTKRSFAIC